MHIPVRLTIQSLTAVFLQDESVTVRWNDGHVEQVSRVPDTPAYELDAMHMNGNGNGNLNGSAIAEED